MKNFQNLKEMLTELLTQRFKIILCFLLFKKKS